MIRRNETRATKRSKTSAEKCIQQQTQANNLPRKEEEEEKEEEEDEEKGGYEENEQIPKATNKKNQGKSRSIPE